MYNSFHTQNTPLRVDATSLFGADVDRASTREAFLFMEEIWKDAIGYEGLYRVSSYGNVMSLKRKTNPVDRLLKANIDNLGYKSVAFVSNGAQKTFRVHRLVAINFLTPSIEKNCVNHINGIKSDNRVENLEWVTLSENVKHAWRTGLCKSHPCYHKMIPVFVRDLKENSVLEFNSITAASVNLGVSFSALMAAYSRKSVCMRRYQLSSTKEFVPVYPSKKGNLCTKRKVNYNFGNGNIVSKAVIVIDKDGNEYAFTNFSAASRAFGINRANMSRLFNGTQSTFNGYKLRLVK